MTDHFAMIANEQATLLGLASRADDIGYFAQEAVRFYSIAGSLRENFPLSGGCTASERQITHILARSLLEGFFWVTYIFDDPSQRSARFGEKMNGFKREYGKFWNEKHVPERAQMEPADAAWASLPKSLDVNSMLAQMTNDYGDKLSYLYFVYRIASFDTHGNSVESLFRAAFGKSCNFSVLRLEYGFDLIANQYLVILQDLRAAGEI